MQIEAQKHRPLFLGDGEHSAAQTYESVRRLIESYNINSGLQQGAEDLGLQGQLAVYTTARDIFEQLTGYRISLTDLYRLLCEQNIGKTEAKTE